MKKEIDNPNFVQKAAALKYEQGTDQAPKLTAKGKGQTATNIIKLAKDNNIPIKTDEDLSSLPQAVEESVFTLHNSEYPEIIETSSVPIVVPMKLYFDNGVSGLSKDAPVEFKGLRLGTVTDIGVDIDIKKNEIATFAKILIEPNRLPVKAAWPELNENMRMKLTNEFFEGMIAKGMRAQLKTGNLLTGKSLVSLDFFPNASVAPVKYANGVLLLPTMPETITGVMGEIANIMAKLETIPIEKIGKELELTLANTNKLVKSFNASENGEMGVQIRDVMDELEKAARSIRYMSEYLERHPEALIKGKSAE